MGSDSVAYVLAKWTGCVSSEWSNGLRYLWTDALGLVLFVSLHGELGDKKFPDQAEQLGVIYDVIVRPLLGDYWIPGPVV